MRTIVKREYSPDDENKEAAMKWSRGRTLGSPPCSISNFIENF